MCVMRFDNLISWVKACAELRREGIAFSAHENGLYIELLGY